MKKLVAGLALFTVTAVTAPTAAHAGGSTDAALALGAFAVLNQLVRGDTIFHAPRPVVVSPPPVVYTPPPVVYTPPPVVYAPPPVVYAPARAFVYVPPAPVVVYRERVAPWPGHGHVHVRGRGHWRHHWDR
jgi:hypothetical protein